MQRQSQYRSFYFILFFFLCQKIQTFGHERKTGKENVNNIARAARLESFPIEFIGFAGNREVSSGEPKRNEKEVPLTAFFPRSPSTLSLRRIARRPASRRRVTTPIRNNAIQSRVSGFGLFRAAIRFEGKHRLKERLANKARCPAIASPRSLVFSPVSSRGGWP